MKKNIRRWKFLRYSLIPAALVLSGGQDLMAQTPSAGSSSPNGTTNQLPGVLVIGHVDPEYKIEDAVTATKTDTPIMETPASVQIISPEVLEDQQVTRLDDALNNVSGVFRANDSFGTGDSFSIRGFDSMEVFYEDGMKIDQYEAGGLTTSLANIEKVEVVKGPASVLYGRAEPGGMVNMVTKKPLDAPFYSLEQQFGSYDFYRTTADATGPIDQDKTWLYRLNVDYENSGSFRDNVFAHRLFVFPTIEWKPDSKNNVLVELEYGGGTEVTDMGLPFLANGTPANVPIHENFVDPNQNQGTSHQYTAKVVGTHEFNEDWKVSATYRAQYVDAPNMGTEFFAGDADGNGNVQRYWFVTPDFNHLTHQVVTEVTGHFETAGIKQTMIAGFDYYRISGGYLVEQPSLPVPSINIYNPVYYQQLPPLDPTQSGRETQGEQDFGAYLQDQAELPGHLFLLAGARLDRASTFETGTFFSANTYDTPPPTPRVGLLWQPVPTVSVYGSYTENFGDTPLGSLPAPGQALRPESAQQFEIGAKTEFLDKKLSVTASIYQLTKQNVPTSDPANAAYTIFIGEARSRGIEFDATGRITPEWSVIAAYSYIDCVTTSDNNTPSLAGLRFPGVPYNSASLWTTYDFRETAWKGLKLGAGVVYRDGELAWESPTGASYQADRVPGYATVNLMASYGWRVGKTGITAQLNVNNLLDRRYFAAVIPSQAQPGQPLSAIGSIRVSF